MKKKLSPYLKKKFEFRNNKICNIPATYLDTGAVGDSRQCLKDAGSSPQTPITTNHLDVPRSLDPNPNLLSPEILTQRRGKCKRNNKKKNSIELILSSKKSTEFY